MGNGSCGYDDPLLPGDANRGHGPLLQIPIPLSMAAIGAVAWKTAQPFPLRLRHEAYPHPSPLPEGEGAIQVRISAVAWKTAQPFPPETSAWGAPSPQPSPRGRGGCPNGYQRHSVVAWKTAQPFHRGLRYGACPHPSPLPEGEGAYVRGVHFDGPPWPRSVTTRPPVPPVPVGAASAPCRYGWSTAAGPGCGPSRSRCRRRAPAGWPVAPPPGRSDRPGTGPWRC